MPRFSRFLSALFAFSLLAACRHTPQSESETAPTGPSLLTDKETATALHGKVSFANHIKPILQSRCLSCHNGKTMPGLFDLRNREAVFQVGTMGPRIVPGKPDQSMLFLNPRGTHKAVKAMPPVGNRLTPDELNILKRWIEQGADWPLSAGSLRSIP